MGLTGIKLRCLEDCISGGSRGESMSLSFLASRGSLHFLALGLSLQSQ